VRFHSEWIDPIIIAGGKNAERTPGYGASCQLTNDKGTWFVATPGTVSIHRSYSDLTSICTKEGFQTSNAATPSGTKGIAFGNILLGGIIGGGVDAATGAAYDYPALISILMIQSTPTP
jgi:hypothetical protein